jgi:hypothetical protein
MKNSHGTSGVKWLTWFVLLWALAAPSAMAQSPVPVINQPPVLGARSPGGTGFTLAVNGTGFVSGSVVKVAGTGTVVGFYPASLVFGCTVSPFTGTCSPPPQTTTLYNNGSTRLRISSITITGSTHFSQTNNCGPGVAPGASCAITVTFGPAFEGSYSGDISVSDDGGGSPQQVPLNGTAAPRW